MNASTFQHLVDLPFAGWQATLTAIGVASSIWLNLRAPLLDADSARRTSKDVAPDESATKTGGASDPVPTAAGPQAQARSAATIVDGLAVLGLIGFMLALYDSMGALSFFSASALMLLLIVLSKAAGALGTLLILPEHAVVSARPMKRRIQYAVGLVLLMTLALTRHDGISTGFSLLLANAFWLCSLTGAVLLLLAVLRPASLGVHPGQYRGAQFFLLLMTTVLGLLFVAHAENGGMAPRLAAELSHSTILIVMIAGVLSFRLSDWWTKAKARLAKAEPDASRLRIPPGAAAFRSSQQPDTSRGVLLTTWLLAGLILLGGMGSQREAARLLEARGAPATSPNATDTLPHPSRGTPLASQSPGTQSIDAISSNPQTPGQDNARPARLAPAADSGHAPAPHTLAEERLRNAIATLLPNAVVQSLAQDARGHWQLSLLVAPGSSLQDSHHVDNALQTLAVATRQMQALGMPVGSVRAHTLAWQDDGRGTTRRHDMLWLNLHGEQLAALATLPADPRQLAALLRVRATTLGTEALATYCRTRDNARHAGAFCTPVSAASAAPTPGSGRCAPAPAGPSCASRG